MYTGQPQYDPTAVEQSGLLSLVGENISDI